MDSGTMALTRNEAPATRHAPVQFKVTRAKVWGAKVWRWHSKTDRPSEQVHKAGFRLVQSGLLKNFWVIAEPCIVDIATGRPVAK